MNDQDRQENYVKRINRIIDIILNNPETRSFTTIGWTNKIEIYTCYANGKKNDYEIIISGDWVTKNKHLPDAKNTQLQNIEKKFLDIMDKMNVTCVQRMSSARCIVCQGLIDTTMTRFYTYEESSDRYCCKYCRED